MAPYEGNPSAYLPAPVSEAPRIATRDEFWSANPHERLRMLAFALRHMPDSHAWDFTTMYHERPCGSSGCAIGLRDALWGCNQQYPIEYLGQKTFDLSYADAGKLFDCLMDRNFGYEHRRPQDVAPAMVADAIDAHLDRAISSELAKAAQS